MISMITRTV